MRENLGILKVENEEKVLKGDYEADLIFIDNGSLTIYGRIYVNYYVSVNNGALIITESLYSEGYLTLINADISGRELNTVTIKAQNSSIYCAEGLNCFGIDTFHTSISAKGLTCCQEIRMIAGNLEIRNGWLEAEDIFSDSDVIVHGNTWVGSVHCFNYLVDGRDNSSGIEAMKIYILGSCSSAYLEAAEIFVGSDAEIRSIIASRKFEIGGTLSGCLKWRGGNPKIEK